MLPTTYIRLPTFYSQLPQCMRRLALAILTTECNIVYCTLYPSAHSIVKQHNSADIKLGYRHITLTVLWPAAAASHIILTDGGCVAFILCSGCGTAVNNGGSIQVYVEYVTIALSSLICLVQVRNEYRRLQLEIKLKHNNTIQMFKLHLTLLMTRNE